jgi:hypothetical protein
MDIPNPATRDLLALMVDELATRDLEEGGCALGRSDFRTMHLAQTALDLLDLPTLAEQPALDLYQAIRGRLLRLYNHDLLSGELTLGLMGELRALYDRHHPTLMDRLPSKKEVPFA